MMGPCEFLASAPLHHGVIAHGEEWDCWWISLGLFQWFNSISHGAFAFKPVTEHLHHGPGAAI